MTVRSSAADLLLFDSKVADVGAAMTTAWPSAIASFTRLVVDFEPGFLPLGVLDDAAGDGGVSREELFGVEDRAGKIGLERSVVRSRHEDTSSPRGGDVVETPALCWFTSNRSAYGRYRSVNLSLVVAQQGDPLGRFVRGDSFASPPVAAGPVRPPGGTASDRSTSFRCRSYPYRLRAVVSADSI